MSATDKRENDKFHIPLIHPVTHQECPVPNNGWRYTPESLEKLMQEGKVLFGEDHTTMPRKKTYLEHTESSQMPTIYKSGSRGKVLLDNMSLDFPFAHSVELYSYIINSAESKQSVVLDFFAGSGTSAHAVINLNRNDLGERKYVMIEMGAHFDSTLMPRVLKSVYSDSWKNGKPSSFNSGVSQFIKLIKLESYEDALNNIELKRPKLDLFERNLEVSEEYLLKYMLSIESRDSLLSTDTFRKPFDYAMKIAVDSAGAYEEQKIDLVETFNYLIGLTVNHIDAQPERGFVTVTGTLPSGEKTLVLWRDCERIDYEGLDKLCDRLAINPSDNEFDVVYINGDHNIPTVLSQTTEEGGETKTLKLRQIEPEFLERMFAVEDE